MGAPFSVDKCPFPILMTEKSPIFTSDNYSLYFSTCSFSFLISFPFPLIIKRALANFKRPRAISPKARSLRLHASVDDELLLLIRGLSFFRYENVLI